MSNRQKINDKRVSRRPSQIVKEGFLTKQGHVVKNWKMRWFVLKEDGSLEYFASPKEKTPLGRIKITKDMRIQVNDATKIKPNCFLLHCARKPFLLVADTNDAKLEWIKAINNIIYDTPNAPDAADLSANPSSSYPSSTLTSLPPSASASTTPSPSSPSPSHSPSPSRSSSPAPHISPPPSLSPHVPSHPPAEPSAVPPLHFPPPHLAQPSRQFTSPSSLPPGLAQSPVPPSSGSPPQPRISPRASAGAPFRWATTKFSSGAPRSHGFMDSPQRAASLSSYPRTAVQPAAQEERPKESKKEATPDIDTFPSASTPIEKSASPTINAETNAPQPPLLDHTTPTPPPITTPSISTPLNNNNNNNHSNSNMNNETPDGSTPKRASPPVRIVEYQLGEVIGKGAFGTVYKGLSVTSGEMVAVKQIALHNISAKDLTALVNEVTLLSSLQHPNIVHLIRCVRTPDTLNIVMEYIEGGSLLDVLKKFGGQVPETLLRSYVAQVLKGLQYLHQKGVLHRDVKAANLLITKSGQLKMADFGIAVLDSDKSSPEHSFAGSPYWLAPEVILLEKPRPASDVWSLGCTIVELVTGSPPYFAMNPLAAMHALADETRQPPIPDAASRELADFLRRCFVYRVEARPQADQLLRHPFITGVPFDLEKADRIFDTEQKVQISSSSSTSTSTSTFPEQQNEQQEDEEYEEENESEAKSSNPYSAQISACQEIADWLTRALDKQRVKESRQLYDALLTRAKAFIKALKKQPNADAEAFKGKLVAVLDRYNREVEGAVEGLGKYDSSDSDDDSDSDFHRSGSESTATFDSDDNESLDFFNSSSLHEI